MPLAIWQLRSAQAEYDQQHSPAKAKQDADAQRAALRGQAMDFLLAANAAESREDYAAAETQYRNIIALFTTADPQALELCVAKKRLADVLLQQHKDPHESEQLLEEAADIAVHLHQTAIAERAVNSLLQLLRQGGDAQAVARVEQKYKDILQENPTP